MDVIAFINNNGGQERTALVYHLAWMLAEMDLNVLVADLDPQSNLTGMFLEEDRLEELWPPGKHPLTIQAVVDPILHGLGDIRTPHVEAMNNRIGLVAGDFGLSGLEHKLSVAWQRFPKSDESAFSAVTALYRAVVMAAEKQNAGIVLIDLGPNLGPINRSALIACQHVVIPLASDLSSLQGLRNLGPQLRAWRATWKELRGLSANGNLPLPAGDMIAMGYVVMGRAHRADRRWINNIPGEYAESVLGQGLPDPLRVEDDPHCLARMTSYRSLMPMAVAARKPMFLLKPADGAIGSHSEAVRDCFREFKTLAERICQSLGDREGSQAVFQ